MKVLALQSFRTSRSLELLAEMAWQYSSQVAKNREVVFVEVEKSHHLFSAAEIIQGLHEKAQALDLPLKISVGKSPAEAWAFLNYKVSDKNKLPLQALAFYLDPFQQKEISRLTLEMLKTFQRLGFQSFKDLEKLPRQGVSSRFGAEGLWALQRVTSDDQIPWPQWKPQEVLEEFQTFDPDQRVQTTEALNFILRPLLERLMHRLSWRHESMTRLSMSLHLEEFSVVKEILRDWDFPFSFPQTQILSVLSILKERLDFDLQRKPLESSVIFVEIRVLEKTPLPNRQKDFFSKKEEDLEMEASLISRLHQKIGEKSVFKASPCPSYRPESAWRPEAGEAIPLPIPLRPLILLKKPQPLQKLGACLILNHKRHLIKSWQGPERLSSEWWTTAFQRQYWIVHLKTGPTWWIFSEASENKPDLFLHGIFD